MNHTQQSSVEVQIFGPSFSNFVRSVMLMCEEHNVSYSTGFELDNQSIEFKSKEHFAIHPYGKLPVIKHKTLTLAETSSICRYIQNQFSTADDSQQCLSLAARIDAFSAIASIYIDKAIIRDYLLEFAFPKGEDGSIRFDVATLAMPAVKDALSVIEKELNQDGVLNQPVMTVADAIVAPMLHYVSTLPEQFNVLPEFSLVTSYLQTLMERPSCQKILVAKS